jgi:hypothetical protein
MGLVKITGLAEGNEVAESTKILMNANEWIPCSDGKPTASLRGFRLGRLFSCFSVVVIFFVAFLNSLLRQFLGIFKEKIVLHLFLSLVEKTHRIKCHCVFGIRKNNKRCRLP